MAVYTSVRSGPDVKGSLRFSWEGKTHKDHKHAKISST